MFRGGVRAFEKKLADADGVEHSFYYKARTPNELAAFAGTEAVFRAKETEADFVARAKSHARFLASSLCTESGDPLVTPQEAELIPAGLKLDLLAEIVKGSNEAGDAKKD